MLEYRLEIEPRLLVRAASDALRGTRTAPSSGWSDDEDLGGASDDDGQSSQGNKPGTTLDQDMSRRYWMPACIVEAGEPDLVHKFEEERAVKEARKAARGMGRGTKATSRGKSTARRGRATTREEGDVSGNEDIAMRTSSVVGTPQSTPKKNRTAMSVPVASELAELEYPVPPVAGRGVTGFFKASKTGAPVTVRADKDHTLQLSQAIQPLRFKTTTANGKGK